MDFKLKQYSQYDVNEKLNTKNHNLRIDLEIM